ncbi:MAG: hypothetical protein ACI9U6_000646 [Loktanella salsilacus]|jgi:hypothetical protein
MSDRPKPTPKIITNDGSVIKGGQNTTQQVVVRPAPPTPTNPKK